MKAAERLTRAYSERNFTAVLLVALAVRHGMKAGKDIDSNEEWDMEWRHVVGIELKDGTQLWWHIAPSDLPLIAMLPQFPGGWDGTFKRRKTAAGAEIIKRILSKEIA